MADKILTPPRRGDPILAKLIADMIEEILDQRAGMRSGSWGMTAAVLAATRPDFFVPATITRVYPSDAHSVDHPASEVFYDVVAVSMPDARLTHAPPFYGRPVKDQSHRIYGAAVDFDCVLVRSHDIEGTPRARLMLLPDSELRATRLCGVEPPP